MTTVNQETAMKTITMTAEQTETYDQGGDDAREPMMRTLRERARLLAAEVSEDVEIHTADGVVAAVVEARR